MDHLRVDKRHDGAISVTDGNVTLLPMKFYIHIIDQASIIQIGNGLKWTVWGRIDQVGASYVASAGDYEITVRRVRPKSTIVNHDGIINLRESRRLKRIAMKKVREEGK